LIALRTQQIIAFESGVTNTVDPLGGSYCVEALTDRLEKECFDIIAQVDQRGGAVKAWQWIQQTYLSTAYEKQKRIENNEQVIVGLNAFTIAKEDEKELDLFEIDSDFEERQIAFLQEVKRSRNRELVERTLEEVTRVSEKGKNTMRAMGEAYKVLATLGEVRRAWEKGVGIT
jgi:methylmalonyl-CoA mutase N-terminal domain/subunit